LQMIAETYRNERDKALQNAEEVDRMVKSHLARQNDGSELNEAFLDAALSGISQAYDVRYGGFGGAPKFPHPSAIEFLLARYNDTREPWCMDIVTKTLHAMANGGVYDQLGGGFHRYSTDEKWVVPHFEKMLYDNAPLLKNYTHAYHATRNPFFKDVALDIIRYVNEVLADRGHGGFYSSQDADVSFGDDGSYFTWSLADAAKVLAPTELEVMKLRYNIYERGEMHHDPTQNVLFVDNEPEQIATILRKPLEDVQRLLDSGKSKLLHARLQRKAPFVDTTIYASWNGMMISAYIHAYRAFGDKGHCSFALKTLERILEEHTTPEGSISHRAATTAREAFLDDQVEIIQALLDAFEATGSMRFFDEAERLMGTTVELFWDHDAHGFADIPHTTATLGALQVKNKPVQDSPTAGANAVAILALLRLYSVTEKTEYRERAEQALRFFSGSVKNQGVFAATYFLALEMFLKQPPHIVVVAPSEDALGNALFQVAVTAYHPTAIVTRIDPEKPGTISRTIKSMLASYTKPAAFICANFVCSPPVYDTHSLTSAMQALTSKAELQS
ncbi:MAG TPA: thioredoxin domain-containing protein, partial [Bacteroidota bacterium]